jgi:very-short-patch-repair endonuclease
MAAVLAVGGGPKEAGAVLMRWGAALSHRSAAAHWGLLPETGGRVELIVPGDGGRKGRPGVRIHRSVSLDCRDVKLRRGIPLTSPARTIADLRRMVVTGGGGGVSERELRRAVRQANVLGLPIGPEAEGDRTRSDLERAFLRLCRRHRLPAPEVNAQIGIFEADFVWPEAGLVVETDGYRYHRGRAAFEDDRARDLELRRNGFTVVRVSESQVDEDPHRIAEVLRTEIASALRRVGDDGS